MNVKKIKTYILYAPSIPLLLLEPHSPAYAGGGLSRMMSREFVETAASYRRLSPGGTHKNFSRPYTTIKLEYDATRKQHFYNMNPDPTIRLVEEGGPISKTEIRERNVVQRTPVIEDKESSALSSQKMPKYESTHKKKE